MRAALEIAEPISFPSWSFASVIFGKVGEI